MRFIYLFMALGCGDGTKDIEPSNEPIDLDGDGFAASEDCDDANAEINPNAEEVCDETDNNCNNEIDEGVQETFYSDNDGDGFGDPSQPLDSCESPEGYTNNNLDCDDVNPDTNPDSPETCDGIDNDCDNEIDENVGSLWYDDLDGDGTGDPSTGSEACDSGSGQVTNGDDCNDADASVYLNAPEICDEKDNDCDESVDEGVENTYYLDNDGDTFGTPDSTASGCEPPEGYVANSDDCNDVDYNVNPAEPERCDYIDNNCNGVTDEDDATDVITWYKDSDGDGFGDAADTDIDCYQPNGFVSNNTDCRPNDATAYPGADEYCDGHDDNCNGQTDEDASIDAQTWYSDNDNDGYGNANDTDIDCYQPAGYVSDNTDCRPNDATAYPGADEYCDGHDDNCNNAIDEDTSVDVQTWYSDIDNDGYGNANDTDIDCYQPNGFVSNNDDCRPNDGNAYPGATEYCDGHDDNCNGQTDEDASANAQTWYSDTDNDGYGNANDTDIDCYQPNGFVSNADDCRPNDGSAYPGAPEYCDGHDDNCNGQTDEDSAVNASMWYRDEDGDGYGNANNTDIACYQPNGFVDNNQDCRPNDASAYPGADEYCDGHDDNCNGQTDEDSAVNALTWYQDNDGDGYGHPNITDTACYQPNNYVGNNDDCRPSDGNAYPGAPEYCDGHDDNCDGQTDESSAVDAQVWYSDNDNDGYGYSSQTLIQCYQPNNYVNIGGDCRPNDNTAHPNATEYCDGHDDDCDGQTDEDSSADASTWYHDGDGDSYGDANDVDTACYQPNNHVANSQDCNDSNGNINPSANEICNSIDDDCDGNIDQNDNDYDTSTGSLYYLDLDNDGFGDNGNVELSCGPPSGNYTSIGNDCDDNDNGVNPSANEVCNEVDDDCNGQIDEDFIDANGIYDSNNHCGECNNSCSGSIANASAVCESDGTVATCVIDACDSGTVLFPNGLGCGEEVTVYQGQGRPGFCGWSTSPIYCGDSDVLLGSCYQNGFIYGTCIDGYDCLGTDNGAGFQVMGSCSGLF